MCIEIEEEKRQDQRRKTFGINAKVTFSLLTLIYP